jgi:N6-L-threonylcarbamoyladenine synthase
MAEAPVILGIETSCDETAVGVVAGDRLLSSVLSSQVEAHARFGGVVPEVAARAHIEAIRPLVHDALRKAGIHQAQVDAIAATRGPGLVGSLVVGFGFGKAFAWSLDKPFLGIDHMEGHLFAPRLEHPGYQPPAVVLLASGGHSQIVHVPEWGRYLELGGTIDDSAGEAFDKVARFMGLGYPGGPAIDRVAATGDPAAMAFPRALRDRPFDLSFSGLKTSVTTFLAKAEAVGAVPPIEDVAASLQEAIVDVLVEKTFNAVEATGVRRVAGGGGVLANTRLRERLAEEADARGVQLFLPSPGLCTDNGAMIAAAAGFHFSSGTRSGWDTDVDPGLRLGHPARPPG